MAQGLLPFKYDVEPAPSGVTALGGLPLYLELVQASGLAAAIRQHVRVAGEQGWLDLQMILAVLALHLAGGDGLADLERLERDDGLSTILRAMERVLLSRRERRLLGERWRKPRRRTLPSPDALAAWLERFHDGEAARPREKGVAYIPAMGEGLRGLGRVNQALLAFLQKQARTATATLDMDATLIETHKRQALTCYKGYKAYQPLNCWWAEHGVMLHSEFRDGNVPAGHQQLRVLQDCLAAARAAGVAKVLLRSDTAGYQQDLLLYCGEGRDPHFGVIEFAVGVDVTQEFRAAVKALPEADWQPLYRSVEGQRYDTGQEFAEVCFVPNWVGHSKKRAEYRFLAIREPLRELDLGDAGQLPFPTEEFAAKGRYKLFGLVTNRTLSGEAVIGWSRERCGKSEEAHAVLKSDLAGGRMPSGRFGANAAWWALTILAHNLNAVLKQVVLGPAWAAKRMKALRFQLIALPGRIVRHARQLILRLGADAATLATLLSARRAMLALAAGPSG